MSTLTRAELEALSETRRRHHITPGEWDDAMRMLIAGATPKQVAEKYGVCESTVIRKRSEMCRLIEEEAAE